MALLWILSLSSALLVCSMGAEVTCPTLFNFYPDAHDCTKFYRCVWGKAKLFNCGAGTRWSQELLTCDHAANVKCDKKPISEIVVDEYTGQPYHKYRPEAQAPDFSVDYDTDYPHGSKEMKPYGNHGQENHRPVYPTHETKHPYGDHSDYDVYGKYRPQMEYHRDDFFKRFVPGHYYPATAYRPTTTYRPTYGSHPTTAGHPNTGYFPEYRYHLNRPYPYNHYGENAYAPSVYARKPVHGRPSPYTPTWNPSYNKNNLEYRPTKHASQGYPKYPATVENWPRSDLFRAGYGYKRIYVNQH